MPEFDPIAVKSKADKIVADDKSKIEDARNLFLEELFDWTDFYTETYPSDEAGPPSSVDNGEQLATKRKTYEAIIELWIQFTAFEISLHQYKKAVDVFEKALIDTLGSKSVVLFIAYAAFCVDRKKLANAQKVYIRGLCAGLASQEENGDCGKTSYRLQSTDLTVDQLYEAVKKQQGVDSSKLAAPSPPLSIPSTSSALPAPSDQQDNANQAPIISSSNAIDVIESKEEIGDNVAVPAVENGHGRGDSTAEGAAATTLETLPPVAAAAVQEEEENAEQQEKDGQEQRELQVSATASSSSSVVTRPDYAAADDLDDVSGLTPQQIIKIYSGAPPILFTALHKEPMASGMMTLLNGAQNKEETYVNMKQELETFLNGCALTDLPSVTPNLRRDPIDYSTWTSADKILDLLESLYSMQAIKERHFDSWMADIRKLHKTQEETLMQKFKTATVALQQQQQQPNKLQELEQNQQAELARFRNYCAVQQELLLALINKSLLALLIEQQMILTSAGFPRFSNTFTESIKSYIHQRKNSLATITTSTNLEFDRTLASHVYDQRLMVCALLSTRLHAVSRERSRAAQLSRTRLARQQSGDSRSGGGAGGSMGVGMGAASSGGMGSGRKRRRAEAWEMAPMTAGPGGIYPQQQGQRQSRFSSYDQPSRFPQPMHVHHHHHHQQQQQPYYQQEQHRWPPAAAAGPTTSSGGADQALPLLQKLASMIKK
eukprot:CAMPEP_0174959844 /NCGR_PEP_ID=MMETSP0004_2-20121128/3394_1 /TAXON_ID=420556 /ORGANISM="Ochromonas sp., Strain CCMP1393" /LENGTH=716 /DNA_ID=CAMNT_0016208191 /DNA_START=160 /DNA_END=2311 /DNA_ORIENTATION=+